MRNKDTDVNNLIRMVDKIDSRTDNQIVTK